MKSKLTPLLIVAAIALGGCVKKGVHEDAMADWAGRYSALEEDMLAETGRADAAEQSLAACMTRESDLGATLSATQEELAACQDRLSEARALLEQSDETAAALAARLEELAAIEAELRERDAILADITGAFEELIENGYVEVGIERGRLVIKMPQDILFESGSAEIGVDGEIALSEVASVLAALDERQFQIEGHTDNVPIETRRFPSNWELSAARALAVVHLFEEVGVPPSNLSAGAFGEHQPRAANDTPENKALNRRIEIVMVPDLQAIFGDITE